MGTIIMVFLILAFIAEVGLGTIIFWIIFGFAVIFGFIWIIVSSLEKSGNVRDRGDSTYVFYTKKCHLGYDYNCQSNCPMYGHCWGECSNNHSDHHSNSESFFHPDTPTHNNEDSDWRGIYMDDTQHYERECDEQHDDDRYNNGGW